MVSLNKKKRVDLTLCNKYKIAQLVDQKFKKSEIAVKFNVGKSVISRIAES